jgi:CrcB protein
MLDLLGVMLGGALGAGARYLMVVQVQESLGTLFPYGTLSVNLLGCFAIGVLTELAVHADWLPAGLRIPLGVGFLGAFTTYSAFAYETVRLTRDGWSTIALSYVAATTILGVVAVLLGVWASRAALRV